MKAECGLPRRMVIFRGLGRIGITAVNEYRKGRSLNGREVRTRERKDHNT